MECRQVSTRDQEAEKIIDERIGLQVDQPLSTMLCFDLSQKQIDSLLLTMQKEQPSHFNTICTVGQQLVNSLNEYYIEDSFIAALQLKLTDFIEFMLVNGLDLTQPALSQSIYQLIECSKYTANDPPLDLLLLLLKYRADPNCIDSNNYKSPLHQAVKYAIVPFVSLLLQNQADPNVVDRKKRVPFNMIKQNSDQQHSYHKIRNLLQEYGAHTHWKQ